MGQATFSPEEPPDDEDEAEDFESDDEDDEDAALSAGFLSPSAPFFSPPGALDSPDEGEPADAGAEDPFRLSVR